MEDEGSRYPLLVALETHRNSGIGSVVRCCVAFNVSTLCIIGSKQFSTHGAHGAQGHISILHFVCWSDFYTYARDQKCILYGISPTMLLPTTSSTTSSEKDGEDGATNKTSMDKVSIPVQTMSWPSGVGAAFVLGHAYSGLSDEMMENLGHFIHVPVPRLDMEKSVKYDAKLAIVLHVYVIATKLFKMRAFEGEKFILDEKKHEASGANTARKGFRNIVTYQPADKPSTSSSSSSNSLHVNALDDANLLHGFFGGGDDDEEEIIG